ncbi:hypothetical protein [Ascidiimonas sp. W6]|uniref:hypothetical protein n=1 Tax=Ascidiimonas meishanensis TaxID=3128903 RepID=UPI0030EC9287
MNDIDLLYHNEFGMAFHWKNTNSINIQKVQLVFRDTGLLLNFSQLLLFQDKVKSALTNCTLCETCKSKLDSKPLLMETPFSELSFAVSYHELHLASELLAGVLFQIEMNHVLKTQKIN